MQVYAYSYDYMECQAWPSAAQARAAVKKRLPSELPVITEQEESLLRRVILFGGTTPLFSDDEIFTADSLVRRLWCSCVLNNDGQLLLKLADVLLKPIVECVSDEQYHLKRTKIYALSATLHSMVYLYGLLYTEPAITHLNENLFEKDTAENRRLLKRFMMAEFDYSRDSQGNLILLHSGLAYPERIAASVSNAQYQATDYTREMIIGGMSELLREEEAAAGILRSELSYALQPGYNPTVMANDIKILIKQGATHEQLYDLIRDKLAVRMTPRLENALIRAEKETVRWQNATSGRLN